MVRVVGSVLLRFRAPSHPGSLIPPFRYRGVEDASEFRSATTGFLAARQKQLASMPQLTADGVRQSMASLPVSPTHGFKPKRTIDVSKSRVVELASVAHGQSSHLEAWELFAVRQVQRIPIIIIQGWALPI